MAEERLTDATLNQIIEVLDFQRLQQSEAFALICQSHLRANDEIDSLKKALLDVSRQYLRYRIGYLNGKEMSVLKDEDVLAWALNQVTA